MYTLEFDEDAWKEWNKLDSTLRDQFKKKLKKVLVMPHIQANKLSSLQGCYKIKLRASGYRLVYQVKDDVVIVEVIAIGKRERNEVYKTAAKRLD